MGTSLRRRSIVGRLTLRAAAWAGALGVTLVALAVWQYWRVSVDALDVALLAEARSLAKEIAVTDEQLDIAVPLELRARVDNDRHYYGIFDVRSMRLDGSAPVAADGGPLPLVRTRAGYREVVVPGVGGTTVVVGRTMNAIRMDVRRLALSLLGASLVVVTLALPLTVWLRRQLARSLAQIDQTARALALGKAARVDIDQMDAEFAGIACVLNEAFDRLEAALAHERQLTSDVSHELRTPVATLVAETEWALAANRSTDDYRESLAVCARQARRMKDLTQSLLTLARIEAGTPGRRHDAVDLRAIVDEALTDMAPLARQRGISLQVEGHATVTGDGVQLRMLVSNLLSNAVRYNGADGSVAIRLQGANARVLLRVADTGPGLDPEQRARVFGRFWRADVSRSPRDGGSGLGLAISQAVAAAHGGSITCSAVEPHGLVFSVDLPDHAPAGDSAQATSPDDLHSQARGIERRAR